MPELPEVEHYRAFFAGHATGRTVADVWADPTIVRNATPGSLGGALRGRRFEEPGRHGKWLIAWTDGPALLVHFGMTGDLLWYEHDGEPHRHDRVVLRFAEGGELRYRNMRKLGGVWLAHDEAEAARVLGTLGPDALALTRAEFLAMLARRRGAVKAALMDQRFVAGVGNLIADETLWQARLHPKRRIETLGPEERDRLFRRIRAVLRKAVESEDYLTDRRGWLSRVRGTPGGACPRCGSPLERTTVGGRTTYFCPVCQT